MITVRSLFISLKTINSDLAGNPTRNVQAETLSSAEQRWSSALDGFAARSANGGNFGLRLPDLALRFKMFRKRIDLSSEHLTVSKSNSTHVSQIEYGCDAAKFRIYAGGAINSPQASATSGRLSNTIFFRMTPLTSTPLRMHQ